MGKKIAYLLLCLFIQFMFCFLVSLGAVLLQESAGIKLGPYILGAILFGTLGLTGIVWQKLNNRVEKPRVKEVAAGTFASSNFNKVTKNDDSLPKTSGNRNTILIIAVTSVFTLLICIICLLLFLVIVQGNSLSELRSM